MNASVGKGTWTASGTWTLPAITLGGALTYGGVVLSNSVTGTGSMILSTGPTFGSVAFVSSTTTAIPATTTISNVSNALWISVSIRSGGATDTVALADGILSLISSAN